jgi:glyoxylase-like metal-dependent hydrolase (beta-lactamase superfamily II)
MSLHLGPHTLDAVESGTFALDGGAMFGIVPKALWQKKQPADALNRIPLAARCLLVRSGDRTILVDTGLGEHWPEKSREMFAISTRERSTDASLGRLGLARADVTDVILTHLHFDHAGGALDPSGNPAFPRAAYHLQRRNWEWAQHPSDRDRGSYRPEMFEGLSRAGVLHLIDGETELFPGIRLLLSEGHTVALQLVRVESNDGWLTYCADLIPTAAHLAPTWGMGYDLQPLVVVEEKKMLVAEAIEDRGILFFEHDPSIQACRVREDQGQVALAEQVTLT